MEKRRIPVAAPSIGDKELEYVTDAVKSGWVSSLGKYVDEFEKRFAEFCATRYGVSTANGTAALHLALMALGIGSGDEVIVPTLTFVASANAVAYTGARPVFVDSHPDYWCIDPAQIEKSLTRRTRAIMVVHLYGHPADMDPVLELARKYHLYVIEDAAEAHGAEYRGRRVGGIGDVSAFSFYGNKIITTGEGGMLLCNNPELAQKSRLLKDHAMDPSKKYWHPIVGYNYRMTNMQAALGLAQLERITEFIERKRQIARWYKEMLVAESIEFQHESSWAKSVYWMVSIVVDECRAGISRDQLIVRLAEAGIETRPLFYPIHTLPPYQGSGEFPVAERLSRCGINLPSSVTLQREDVQRVVEELKRAVKR